MSILIVDQNLKELYKLKTELESAGYDDVVAAESVGNALAYYGVDCLGKVPASVELILMDFATPDAQESGFRTGTRASASTGNTVMLGLVDQNNPAMIKRAAVAGAMDVICRPVHKAELLMRFRSALALKAERDAVPPAEGTFATDSDENALDSAQGVSHTTKVLSLASHELKTPLANISGFVDLILLDWERHGAPSEKQQKQMEAVQRNGFRMDALVNDIMAMANIESGTLEISPTDLDLAEELDHVLGYVQGQLNEKRMTLDLIFAEDLSPVHADELRLSQIMVNLLGNACKYSPPDTSITVEVSATDRFAQIDLTDHGYGISAKDQVNLFCQFHRVNNPSAQSVSGTGLGLFVTKQLVEAHGGQIWVKSEEGEGSTFSLTLPLSKLAASQSLPVEQFPELAAAA
ncbi:MAG: ATP-binding protein [Chloroflexi bacterium]|nr:ATP-binding protein [Chloroflexota bacterium]